MAWESWRREGRLSRGGLNTLFVFFFSLWGGTYGRIRHEPRFQISILVDGESGPRQAGSQKGARRSLIADDVRQRPSKAQKRIPSPQSPRVSDGPQGAQGRNNPRTLILQKI